MPIFGGCLDQTIDNLGCIEINILITWFYNQRTEKNIILSTRNSHNYYNIKSFLVGENTSVC